MRATGARSLARRARALEERLQRIAVALRDERLHALQLVAVDGELPAQRAAIRETNVAPHRRVTAGQSSEIAKPGPGMVEQLGAVAAARDLGHECIGKQVRQVTDGSEDRVVAGRLELVHIGPAARPAAAHPLERMGRGFRKRGQDHPAFTK